MAEVLKDNYFKIQERVRVSPAYPWNEWADGRVRRLTQGVDFWTVPRDLVRQARRAAHKRGMKVHVETGKVHVIVQFVLREDTPREPTNPDT